MFFITLVKYLLQRLLSFISTPLNSSFISPFSSMILIQGYFRSSLIDTAVSLAIPIILRQSGLFGVISSSITSPSNESSSFISVPSVYSPCNIKIPSF